MLHFVVFLWGWTPVLGRAISVGELQLVWFRIAITLLAVFAYFFIIKQSLKVSVREVLILTGIGTIIAMHWLFFYGAIKASNVAVTMAAFSTATLFTSLIEPLLLKRRIQLYELIIGLTIVAAIVLIFSVEFQYWLGITLGILAALTSSIFSVLNAMMIKKMDANKITFYELLGGLSVLSVYFFFKGTFTATFFELPTIDWFFLGILALVCTAFPFITSINLMKKISPYTLSLTVNLETVYGIILAYLFWGDSEKMTFTFYIGTGIIFACIILNVWLKNKFTKPI